MPRLFIAIDLPEKVREDIVETYTAIHGTKWISEQQIHLTLRFIGDVDSGARERIVHALESIEVPPFTMQLKGVGVFPPRKEPRILWIGIPDNPMLSRLQAKIERAMIQCGYEPEERKFHPHITIARLNNANPERLAHYIVENNLFSSEPFDISEFHLYESILRREGAHYLRDASFQLTET